MCLSYCEKRFLCCSYFLCLSLLYNHFKNMAAETAAEIKIWVLHAMLSFHNDPIMWTNITKNQQTPLSASSCSLSCV